jgi:perosamine synthetase
MFERKNDLPVMDTSDGVVLFHPHIPKSAQSYVADTLNSRWIGQGPKVDKFENDFRIKFEQPGPCMAVGSGTDALHLAYILAGIGPGDEVLTPIFTCTATNIPLLYIGAQIKFVDINPLTLNMCVSDLKRKISRKTKAIVVVHYGGLPCDMDEINILAAEFGIPVIQDAAHALGATYNGQHIANSTAFTMYSFQAIKHLTTGDGGLLTYKDEALDKLARRLRWFGIDRTDKQKGIWENDIREVGYKYQMTDIGAALGLAGLQEFDQTLSHRKALYSRYLNNLSDYDKLKVVHDFDKRKDHAAWLFTILVNDRQSLMNKLRSNGIESGQTHYRNDRYSIFANKEHFPNMDKVDNEYLVLPLHTKVELETVDRICEIIRGGW